MASCDVDRIEQFLQHELSLQEEQAFEAHLSTCPSCCQQLQETSADASWWNRATDWLQDTPEDLEQLTKTLLSPAADGEAAPLSSTVPAAVQNVLSLLGPTDDPRMLGRIGPYDIVGVVGAGGMSVVLKALDRSLNRYVAIKVLAPHLATGGAARQRFAREAQAAAAIVHENVIAIHGVDEALGLPYLVMPYVKGTSLQARLRAEGSLELKEILRIATQTAAGLAAAHAQGLIHRDVKPANILLAEGVERVTITDFGLARAADDASLTRSGTIAGTPQYMSPEQARGESVDQRTDLFSLGSVIYAMCTGRPPFRAESSFGVLRRISDSQPRPITATNPEIPRWLARLVERLHAKSPDERYQTATAVASDLERCLAYVQQPTRETLPATLLDPPREHFWYRHRTTMPWVAAALLCAITVLTVPWRGRTTATPTSPRSPSSTSDHHAYDAISEPSPGAIVPHPDSTSMAPTDAASSESSVDFPSPSPWFDDTDQELWQLETAIRELESEFP